MPKETNKIKEGIEYQVCSLELAKRLEKLGVEQHGGNLFNYYEWADKNSFVCSNKEVWGLDTSKQGFSFVAVAFTVSELGEMLPIGYGSCCVYTNYYDKKWKTIYMDSGASISHKEIADTEANARAQMLIYLLEKNLCPIKK